MMIAQWIRWSGLALVLAIGDLASPLHGATDLRECE